MPKKSDDSLMELPETNSISKGNRMKLEALLKEIDALSLATKRLSEAKEEARNIMDTQGLNTPDGKALGVRFGEIALISRYNHGRRSLDRTLLIENGVTPKQIESSMKEGNGYFVTTLMRLGQQTEKEEW